MSEKTYVINDRVVVKEEYLKMSKEERRKAIQEIIDEDNAKRSNLPQTNAKIVNI